MNQPKQLRWSLLHKDICPYCENPLVRSEADNELQCTQCRFHIGIDRAETIKSHRRRGDESTVKLHWQYLKAGLCPICHDPVKKIERSTGAVHKCTRESCEFVIVDSKLQEALARPDHPINSYPNPMHI